jgi:hypothetical protein
LVCIPTRQQPLLGEHFPDHRHLLTGRECRKILAVQRVVIVFEPDDAAVHSAASLGSPALPLGFHVVFHVR